MTTELRYFLFLPSLCMIFWWLLQMPNDNCCYLFQKYTRKLFYMLIAYAYAFFYFICLLRIKKQPFLNVTMGMQLFDVQLYHYCLCFLLYHFDSSLIHSLYILFLTFSTLMQFYMFCCKYLIFDFISYLV